MSFWKKEHDHQHGITMHYCEKHDFRTSSPLEIEEHERFHASEEVGFPL